MKRNILEAAVTLASNVFNVRSRHGAVIFTDNKILGRGYNRKIKGFNKVHTFHAETSAAFNAHDKFPREINGAYCLVIRINKRGKLTNSKPCDCCQKTLKAYGIKEVFYSVEGGAICQMKLQV